MTAQNSPDSVRSVQTAEALIDHPGMALTVSFAGPLLCSAGFWWWALLHCVHGIPSGPPGLAPCLGCCLVSMKWPRLEGRRVADGTRTVLLEIAIGTVIVLAWTGSAAGKSDFRLALAGRTS